MTADIRTAAQRKWEEVTGYYTANNPEHCAFVEGAVWGATRAALVAAQGAAPQALNVEKLLTVIGVALDVTKADVRGEIEASIRREVSHWLEQGDDAVLTSSTVDEDARSLSAWPTVDEVRMQFEKAADRIAFDRMIAEVERASAEKALTDAADELEHANASPNLIELESRYGGFYSGIRSTTASTVEKLRARAAALGLTAGQEGGSNA